jgi:hypothetical protein
MIAADRFYTRFICDLETKCWVWRNKIISRYPEIYADGKRMLAHRFAVEQFRGTIPTNMKVCHSCDNTLCVNPDHLWLGTQKDNLRDMRKKGRGYILPAMSLESHPQRKLTREDWDDIVTLRSQYSSRELAIIYGVSSVHIRGIWAKYRSRKV